MSAYWGSDYWNDGYWEGDYWGGTVSSPSGEIYLLADFSTGETVTIDIYRLADNALVIDGASMSEISTTGTFKYAFSQIVSTRMEYFYIANNGTTDQQGKAILNSAIPFIEGVWQNTDNPTGPDTKAAALARVDLNTQEI